MQSTRTPISFPEAAILLYSDGILPHPLDKSNGGFKDEIARTPSYETELVMHMRWVLWEESWVDSWIISCGTNVQ